MKEVYDFNQHPYCIHIFFDEDQVFLNTFFSRDKMSTEVISPYTNKDVEERASLLYNVGTEQILARGDEADERSWSEEDQITIFYVNNILMKLNDIFLKRNQPGYQGDDVHTRMILTGVTLFLKQLSEICPLDNSSASHSTDSDYHFAITIPTFWNDEIRENLIRPLFIQAGLINKHDHHDRLLLFPQIESDFRYLQSLDDRGFRILNSDIKNSHLYSMYRIKMYDNCLAVALDFFSAHYPPLTRIDTRFVPKVLKSIYFTVPLDSKIRMLENKRGKSIGPTDEQLLANKESECDQASINSEKSIDITDLCPDMLSYTKSLIKHELDIFSKTSHGKLYTAILLRSQGFNDPKYYKYKFLENLFNWIKDLGTTTFNTKIMPIGRKSDTSLYLVEANTVEGSKNYIKEHKQISNRRMPPSLIPKEIEIDSCNTSLISLFKDSKPNYIINIDILSKRVKFSCALIGDDGLVKNCTGYSTINIQPLEKFFIQSAIYQKPVLRISKRLKLFMESNSDTIYFDLKYKPIKSNSVYTIKKREKFGKIYKGVKSFIKNYIPINSLIIQTDLKAKQHEIKSIVKNDNLNINNYIDENKFDEFFSKVESTKSTEEEDFVFISQENHIHIFLRMYLGYVNKLAENELSRVFGNDDWKKKNTGFAISFEKNLIDKTMGSNDDLHKLLFVSGATSKLDNHRKSRIVIRGEGVLPAIQQKLNLDLPLRLNFIIAQLYQTHIQVTLHQVVKTKSLLENASSIVVKDKIIPIEKAINTICKNIWNNMKSTGVINYCDYHKDKENTSCSLYSLSSYKHALEKIRSHIFDIFKSSEMDPAIMDDEQILSITNMCDCSINLSLRNIIDIGLKPTIQYTTTVIASSIDNIDLFGDYKVDFLFILGDIITLRNKHSPLYRIQKILLQKSIDISIVSKEKDTQAFVLQESLCQLLKPTLHTQPYLYNSFTTGNLYHVSSETYGILINSKIQGAVLSYRNDASILKDDHSAIIVLQKGEIIPDKGLGLRFNIDCKAVVSKDIENSGCVKLELIRIKHSENMKMERVISLDDLSYDRLSIARFFFQEDDDIPISLKIRPNIFDHSLLFSMRKIGNDITDDIMSAPNALLEEHLTLSYY